MAIAVDWDVKHQAKQTTLMLLTKPSQTDLQYQVKGCQVATGGQETAIAEFALEDLDLNLLKCFDDKACLSNFFHFQINQATVFLRLCWG